jgi:hypothetical protein
VSDGETLPLFDGETISVNFTAGDPDANKSKPKAKCVTCTSNGRALLAVLIIEGVVIGLFVLHIIYNFCSSKGDIV